MSDENGEFDDKNRGNRSSNASASTNDPRVSRGIAVGLVIFGTAVVAIGGWIGSTLVGLRESMATVVAQNAGLIQQLNRNDIRDDVQDVRLGRAERDIAVMEGKVLRGIAEASDGH